MSSFRPSSVHLVGSLPRTKFSTVKDVFSRIPPILGRTLKRIPDGELGDRHYYIMCQQGVFPPHILKPLHLEGEVPTVTQDTGVSGISPASLQFDSRAIKPLMYDEAAIESYRFFRAAREAGDIPPGTRFQVSLPSPLEAPAMFVKEAYQESAAALYEYEMLEVLKRIQENIPAEDLAIQWDISVTIALIEGKKRRIDIPLFSSWLEDPLDYSIQALSRVAAAVSRDVEIGFHLCYGDINHQHFVQPEDLGLLVEVAQALLETVHSWVHIIHWIHMPVPKDRTDLAYFSPLKTLLLPRETRLFLGLIHANDDEGTIKRIEAAWKAFGTPFGVASECGMGRTTKEDAESILTISKSCCATDIED